MWLKHAYPIFDIGDWIKNISIEIDSWSKKIIMSNLLNAVNNKWLLFLPMYYWHQLMTHSLIIKERNIWSRDYYNVNNTDLKKILFIILLAKQVPYLWKTIPLCPIKIIYHSDVRIPQAAIRSNLS